MIQVDKKEMAKVIIGLAANFGVTPPDPLFDLWHGAFQVDNMSIEDIRKAASKIIRTKIDGYGRLPTYAELLAAADRNPVRIEDIATEQAGKVIQAIRKFGRYQNPKFKNQVTAALLSSRWSWGRLCEMTESELGWFAKEFVDAYRAFDILEKRPAIEMTAELKQLTAGIGK